MEVNVFPVLNRITHLLIVLIRGVPSNLAWEQQAEKRYRLYPFKRTSFSDFFKNLFIEAIIIDPAHIESITFSPEWSEVKHLKVFMNCVMKTFKLKPSAPVEEIPEETQPPAGRRGRPKKNAEEKATQAA